MAFTISLSTPNLHERNILAGIDTGATNTRVRGFEINNKNQLSGKPVFEIKVKTNDYDNYPDLLADAFQRANANVARIAAVASGIPGPFNRETQVISNSNASKLKQINLKYVSEFLNLLGIPVFGYLNDLEATAWGLSNNGPELIVEDLNPNATDKKEIHKAAVMAQGTGLGQGSIVMNNGKPVVIGGEGGHFNLPRIYGDEQIEQLAKFLATKYSRLPETEDIISAHGIVNAYLFVTGKEKLPSKIESLPADEKAGAIARKALEGDRDCREAMKLFVKVFGAQARETVYQLCLDTIFLAGNALSQKELLKKDFGFLKAFLENSRFSEEILKNVRIGIVDSEGLAEQGSALFLADLLVPQQANIVTHRPFGMKRV